MKSMTVKQLKRIRNSVILAGMSVSFLIWLCIPSLIENNRLVHVGNGKYGSKLGFLLILALPLFSLIPQKPGEELHTEDAVERMRLEEEWELQSQKTQILYAVLEAATACLVMALAVVFG